MTYYNYHLQAKKLLNSGHLQHYEFVEKWNAISPVLVLYFDNHQPMPIRIDHWDEYLELIKKTMNKS